MADEVKFVLMFVAFVVGLLSCSELQSQQDDYYGPEDCVIVWYQTGPECE